MNQVQNLHRSFQNIKSATLILFWENEQYCQGTKTHATLAVRHHIPITTHRATDTKTGQYLPQIRTHINPNAKDFHLVVIPNISQTFATVKVA